MQVDIIAVLNDNYVFVAHDPKEKITLAIDPAEASPVLDHIQARGWTLNYVLNTHHHSDHVGGNCELKRATGCQIVGFANDRRRIPCIDILVDATSQGFLPRLSVRVMETPGHTSGHICYHLPQEKIFFCGDTLFSLGCGRLFEGTADQLYMSLQQIRSLDPETRIYCTHEYTVKNGAFALTVDQDNPDLADYLKRCQAIRKLGTPTVPTTLATELRANPFLRTSDPKIQRAVGVEENNPISTLAALRRLRDAF